jgi:predicted peptidase
LLTFGCNSDPTTKVNASAPINTGFLTRTVTVDGAPHQFAVFLPYSYSTEMLWPTIVFLHGIGETGSDAKKNLSVGLAPIIAEYPSTFPFVVIFPQSPGDWTGADRERLVLACLDDCQHEFAIDPQRIILTGLSTGGYGTWHIGAQHPNRFAALVPLCAYASFEDVPKLTHIPIWAFHNSGDPFVWSSGSKQMVQRINAASGQAKYTQYGAIGHDCWSQAYRDKTLWDWMLQQRRGSDH